MNIVLFFLRNSIFTTWKNSQKKTQKKENENKKETTLTMYNYVHINNLSSYTIHYIQGCMKKKREENTRLNLSSHHTVKAVQLIIGYEPADLTVHPPRAAEGGFIFFV